MTETGDTVSVIAYLGVDFKKSTIKEQKTLLFKILGCLDSFALL